MSGIHFKDNETDRELKKWFAIYMFIFQFFVLINFYKLLPAMIIFEWLLWWTQRSQTQCTNVETQPCRNMSRWAKAEMQFDRASIDLIYIASILCCYSIHITNRLQINIYQIALAENNPIIINTISEKLCNNCTQKYFCTDNSDYCHFSQLFWGTKCY